MKREKSKVTLQVLICINRENMKWRMKENIGFIKLRIKYIFHSLNFSKLTQEHRGG